MASPGCPQRVRKAFSKILEYKDNATGKIDGLDVAVLITYVLQVGLTLVKLSTYATRLNPQMMYVLCVMCTCYYPALS